MEEFLSPAWLARLDEAARSSSRLAALGGRLVLEQRVSDTPAGECRYQVVLGQGPARVDACAGGAPDVVLSTDYETARAIHGGSDNAQRAIAAGRLRVHGNLDALLEHADALAALDDLFADVRSRTEVADDRGGEGGGPSGSACRR